MYWQLVPRFSLFEWIALLLFAVVFVFSIFMLLSFYVCDSGTCKAYTVADTRNTASGRTLALLDEIGNDGMWPIAFNGALIIAVILLWWFRIPFDVRNFGFLFFIPFAIIYFLFSFVFHHYVKPITRDVKEHVAANAAAE